MQSIGGWGGAFYYWNAPLGAYILPTPRSSRNDAVFLTEVHPLPLPSADGLDPDTAARLGLLGQGLATSGQAKAPGFIKDEIRNRAISIALGRSPAADPNQIGEYSYHRGIWTTPQPYSELLPFSLPPTPVRDPDVIKQRAAERPPVAPGL